MSNLVFFLTAWIVGGAMTHSLSLMTHEVSHNLVFKSQSANKYLGIFCNIGMGFWSSTMFKRYHMEHHQFQGYEKDVDIPTHFEAKLFTGVLGKLIYIILQPILYGGRPGIIRPKALSKNEYINIAVVAVTDLLIVRFLGLHALIFMITGLLLGMGVHPCAGHLIAEHYTFEDEAETYSYYGPLNLLCWNVGLHNEHHDFPRVPGWRLPEVTKIAPEFYENLPIHKSWCGVIYSFITDPKMTVYSRVKRAEKKTK
jgi:sphingolipid delta-4 desaturase